MTYSPVTLRLPGIQHARGGERDEGANRNITTRGIALAITVVAVAVAAVVVAGWSSTKTWHFFQISFSPDHKPFFRLKYRQNMQERGKERRKEGRKEDTKTTHFADKILLAL